MSAGGDTDIDDAPVVVATASPTAARTGAVAGRVAVVTGGTRGIGRGIAEAFLAEGGAVMVSGKSTEKGKRALAEMDAGDWAEFQACDVRDQREIEALVDATRERFGRLDILVNNAGGTSGFAPIHELSDEAWLEGLNWNINAVFWATRRAIPYMLENSWGRIINISSVEGKQGNKAAVSHYITNKHAINGFTKATAFEYGTAGITCNAICPGAIETDLMREAGQNAAQSAGITYEQFLDHYAQEAAIKRLNTVEEVAACALWLASPPGGGVTGALINVDGGTSQW